MIPVLMVVPIILTLLVHRFCLMTGDVTKLDGLLEDSFLRALSARSRVFAQRAPESCIVTLVDLSISGKGGGRGGAVDRARVLLYSHPAT